MATASPPQVQIVAKDSKFNQFVPPTDVLQIQYSYGMTGHCSGPAPPDLFFDKLLPKPEHVSAEGPSLEECLARADFQPVQKAKAERDMQIRLNECIRKIKLSKRLQIFDTGDKRENSTDQRPDHQLELLPEGEPNEQWEHPSNTKMHKPRPFNFWKPSLAIESKFSNGKDGFTDDKRSVTNNTTAGSRTRGQLGLYADQQFACLHMRFLYQLEIVGRHARILYYDRSGVIVCKSFDYALEKEYLVRFLWLWARMTPEQQGWDSTVRDATAGERQTFVDAVGRFLSSTPRQLPVGYDPRGTGSKVYVVQVADDDQPSGFHEVIIGSPFYTSRSVPGRGTCVYLAYSTIAKEICVLKDSWAIDDPAFEPEKNILDDLKAANVPGCPSVICGGDVVVGDDSQATAVQDWATNQEYREWRTPCSPWIHKHVHRRILMDFVYPVECVKNSEEFLTVIRGVAECMGHADQIGIRHRDLTPAHMGFVDTEDGIKPILMDWDHAGRKDEVIEVKPGGVVPYCSGTVQFMSADLLQDHAGPHETRRKTHCLIDDAQSLLWVLAYGAFHWFHHDVITALGTVSHNLFDEMSKPVHAGGPYLWFGGQMKRDVLRQRLLANLPFASPVLKKVLTAIASKWSEYYNFVMIAESLPIYKSNAENAYAQLEDPFWYVEQITAALEAGRGAGELPIADRAIPAGDTRDAVPASFDHKQYEDDRTSTFAEHEAGGDTSSLVETGIARMPPRRALRGGKRKRKAKDVDADVYKPPKMKRKGRDESPENVAPLGAPWYSRARTYLTEPLNRMGILGKNGVKDWKANR
ncbi:hypothetical protein PsYK624_081210 [Phanerochaete sordida]|uniref:Fungal-type protein kinase domain-containing protein n=1 Tax=Phanerochaete sordida TaxID=48140 RepID=A0A9P3GDV5_9APHY|nr:hypothetical protein PsYK624_081210 [Phanerochaete sordida]